VGCGFDKETRSPDPQPPCVTLDHRALGFEVMEGRPGPLLTTLKTGATFFGHLRTLGRLQGVRLPLNHQRIAELVIAMAPLVSRSPHAVQRPLAGERAEQLVVALAGLTDAGEDASTTWSAAHDSSAGHSLACANGPVGFDADSRRGLARPGDAPAVLELVPLHRDYDSLSEGSG
jgi:hypothetical protein